MQRSAQSRGALQQLLQKAAPRNKRWKHGPVSLAIWTIRPKTFSSRAVASGAARWVGEANLTIDMPGQVALVVTDFLL